MPKRFWVFCRALPLSLFLGREDARRRPRGFLLRHRDQYCPDVGILDLRRGPLDQADIPVSDRLANAVLARRCRSQLYLLTVGGVPIGFCPLFLARF
jgi:hypothetical protein